MTSILKKYRKKEEFFMAISRAVQEGSWVKVYDMNNRQIFSEHGTLYGYTSGSVSVKEGNWVKTYDENHRQIASDHV